MQYRRLGRTGLLVSEVCMGTMTFGGAADEEASRAIVERCLDAGVNFFDTADVYTEGRSEEILGRLVTGRRHDLVIATKAFNATGPGVNDAGLSRKHLIAACEASLRRLGTDYVDLYQVHGDDPWTPLDETLRALDDLVRSGKVRYVGASNYGAWRLCEALWTSETRGLARYDCLQPLYNLVERGVDAELLPLCRAKGVGLIAWSPLAGGWLTGKYREGPAGDARLAGGGGQAVEMGRFVDRERILDALLAQAGELGVSPAAVALRWVMDMDGVTCAIFGARDVAPLEDHLVAVDLELPFERWKALERASRPPALYPAGVERFMARRRSEQVERARRALPGGRA